MRVTTCAKVAHLARIEPMSRLLQSRDGSKSDVFIAAENDNLTNGPSKRDTDEKHRPSNANHMGNGPSFAASSESAVPYAVRNWHG
jgi:hypothetical protein